MRDYACDCDGKMTPVEKMPTAIIMDCLRDGVNLRGDVPPGLTEWHVMERLRIELVARKLEGRL